jgi:5-methylthioadenosine/S-adenosylhomocysteine deaminase
MKFGSLLQKSHRWDATVASASAMMKMATMGSKDLAFVDLNDVRMLPHHDLLANVVYSGGTVTDLLVDDKFVLRDGEITTFDEEKVKREFCEAASELLG